MFNIYVYESVPVVTVDLSKLGLTTAADHARNYFGTRFYFFSKMLGIL